MSGKLSLHDLNPSSISFNLGTITSGKVTAVSLKLFRLAIAESISLTKPDSKSICLTSPAASASCA